MCCRKGTGRNHMYRRRLCSAEKQSIRGTGRPVSEFLEAWGWADRCEPGYCLGAGKEAGLKEQLAVLESVGGVVRSAREELTAGESEQGGQQRARRLEGTGAPEEQVPAGGMQVASQEGPLRAVDCGNSGVGLRARRAAMCAGGDSSGELASRLAE